MPYPKLKSETYNCQGGVNLKISQYIAKEGEFLQLLNFGFDTLGALTTVPGTTLFSQGPSPNVVMTGVAAYNSPLFITNTIQSAVTFSLLTTTQLGLFSCTGTTFATLAAFPVAPVTSQHPIFSFAFGGSGLFGCDNWNYFAYYGASTAWNFGLPKPAWGAAGTTTLGFTGIGGTGGASGTLVLYLSLVRQDGLFGPSLAYTAPVVGNSAYLFDIPAIPSAWINPNPTGISGIRAWVSLNGGVALGYTGLFSATFSPQALGITVGFNYTAVGWSLTTPQPYDYQGAFLYGLGSTQGSDNAAVILPNGPGLTESFAGRLWSANFRERANRVVFSEPGTPEVSDYQNFFDVSDASALTAMRAYFTQLLLFKYGETWALSGTGPDTFQLSQISKIYGCVSKRAACVWNQNLWFLDAKGIYEFNGSNIQYVSAKLEPYFKRMDQIQARTRACIFHYKQRNEIWCSIPLTDGTGVILIYDYVAEGWYTRNIPLTAFGAASPFVMDAVQLGQTTGQVFFSPSAALYVFGQTYYTDPTASYTAIIKSRYISGEMGNSVTKLWRRLYVDATMATGLTYLVSVNLYADKGASPYLQTTMALSQYQNRIDFGVPAKSLAVELIYPGGSFLQINGFTVEYRFQRAT